MEEDVDIFIESISSSSSLGQAINLSNKILMLNHDIISRATFGNKDEGHDTFIKLMNKQMELGQKLFIPAIFPSLKFISHLLGIKQTMEKQQAELDAIFKDILKAHRATSKTRSGHGLHDEDDFIDVLLKLQASGDQSPITDLTISALIVDIFVGASENPSTTIEWAMAEMLVNTKVMKKAQAEVRAAVSKRGGKIEECDIKELTYLNDIIKETLRLHPAVPLNPRECQESCEINGYKIPSNTNVMINTWAIGRDPEYWVDPESFRSERFLESSMDLHGPNGEFIPFGGGRRICPGISFAMASMEVPLAHLLYHFDWKLPNGKNPKDVDMTEVAGVNSRRKVELFVVPVPYRLPS